MTTLERIKDEIRAIVINAYPDEINAATADTRIHDLPLDSLDLIESLMGIEDAFRIEIPDEVSEKFETLGDIVKYVDAQILERATVMEKL